MNFLAEIKIMPLKELLDPQGKAVMGGLSNLGLQNIEDVRIGKHIQLNIEADNAVRQNKLRKKLRKSYWQILLWKNIQYKLADVVHHTS